MCVSVDPLASVSAFVCDLRANVVEVDKDCSSDEKLILSISSDIRCSFYSLCCANGMLMLMLKRSAMVWWCINCVSIAFSSVLIDEIDISQSIAYNMEAYRHRQKFNQTPVSNIDPFHVILLFSFSCSTSIFAGSVESSILFPEQMSFITLYLAFQILMRHTQQKNRRQKQINNISLVSFFCLSDCAECNTVANVK